MTSAVYLDHAGAGRYLPEQLEACMRQLNENLLSNPHSKSASSKLATELIDQARYRVLDHFHTTCDEYSVIFTSGCTAALKLISESLDWNFICDQCKKYNPTRTDKNSFASKSDWTSPGPKFAYLMDNHTSVVGMRQHPSRCNASIHCIRPDDVDDFIEHQKSENPCQCIRVFAFPGQSNFCGRKYIVKNWIEKFQKSRWIVCLDAAALVSTSDVDLRIYKPDFMALSFYKIFGYPTGLGALLVRSETIGVKNGLLKKNYFGGGTVQVALNTRNFVSFRNESLSERFEDGTIPFQQILALKQGFDAMKSKGGIHSTSSKVFALALYTYKALENITHANGAPIAVVYCHNNFNDPNTQGPIINFNLLRPNGSYIGYAEAEKMAELYDIHWRTGCFCNQGACQMYLRLSDEELMENFESGKICGDTTDLINGRPVGSIRISFGWTSTISDAQHFVRMIWECFVDRGSPHRSLQQILLDIGLEPFELSSIPKNAKRYEENSIATVANDAEKLTKNSNFDVLNGKAEFFEALETMQNGFHTNEMTLTDIFIYPVKSCAPFTASQWTISKSGFDFDRHWMITTNDGLCLNQKREPKMCTIKTEIDNQRLILSNDYSDKILSVPLHLIGGQSNDDAAIAGPYCQSKVCADRVSTADCGDLVGAWIDDILDRNGCRLVTQTDDIPRKGKGSQNVSISLANEEQYLLLHRPSIRLLHKLIQKTSQEITENDLILRFRPNIVIDGGSPFEEDKWKTVIIGNLEFQCVGKCTRCQMICVDQNTGEMDKNILLALRELRHTKTTFGIYLQASPDQIGMKISKGEKVTITTYNEDN